MQVMTTDRVIQFAVEALIVAVQNLLDDPSDLLHPENGESPRAAIARFRDLAADLDLDFEEILKEFGSPFEIERLLKIEAGTYKR